jgi:hypothetical protein
MELRLRPVVHSAPSRRKSRTYHCRNLKNYRSKEMHHEAYTPRQAIFLALEARPRLEVSDLIALDRKQSPPSLHERCGKRRARPSAFKLQRVTNVPEPPPSTRLMSCVSHHQSPALTNIGARGCLAKVRRAPVPQHLQPRALDQGAGDRVFSSCAVAGYRSLYAGVCWCPAETRTGLSSALAGLAVTLGAATAEEADLEMAAKRP